MKTVITSFILLFMSTQLIAGDSTVQLHYIVRQPLIASANPPAIILLHGYGSNEKDLFSFSAQLPGKYLILSARAPIEMGGGSYAWYALDFSTGKTVFSFQEEEKSRKAIIALIEQVSKKYHLNTKEIYLCGFSQGAIMSYSVALTRPDLVKGIAAMSGRLLEEIKPYTATNEQLKQLRIFISHGLNDQVLPVQDGRNAATYLKTKGITPLYKEYTEGHGINGNMLHDLVDWLK
jgi:phospholipase/carboxylesterase